MTWYDLYMACYSDSDLGKISAFQCKMLSDIKAIADVQRAINYRFKLLRQRKPHQPSSTTGKQINKRVPHHELYIEIAKYYESHYKNGCKLPVNQQPSVHTPQDYVDHARTKRTKQKNYTHARYDTIINELKACTHSRCTNDDRFIALIYSQAPKRSFSTEELNLWSDVYTFATAEEIEARFVNRESKREADIYKGTFCKIAEEIYRDDFEIYSCKDRFFIPQFVKRHDGVSSTVLDRLLRYNSDPECFSRADIEYIKERVGDAFDEDDFFYTIDLIIKMSKKKQP